MTELEQTNDIIKSEKRSISDIEMEAAPQTSDHSAADNDDNYKKAMHRASEQVCIRSPALRQLLGTSSFVF